MKKHSVLYTYGIMLMAISASAQGVSKDSLNMLTQQKESIESSKKVNEKRIELAKLENELAEKTNKANEAALEAQKAASENEDFANRLRNDAQNKDLANQANKSAKQAEKSSKNARKASEDLEDLNKKIESLRKEIAEEEAKSGNASNMAQSTINSGSSNAMNQSNYAGQGNGSNQSNGYNQSNGSNQSNGYNSQNGNNQSSVAQYPNNQQVIQRTVPVEGNNANANEIAQKVLESTYKNYPQQSGQPSIIINNIIVPSEYDKSRNQGGSNQNMQSYGGNNMDDYEAFKAWQNQRRGRGGNAYNGQNNTPQNTEQAQYIQAKPGERLTFRDRFGEVPARNSGLWVIPMVGVHASNFNADFKEGTADGRTGWNAGLDFRIHMKRFFIQPGAHYFSSSLRVTSEDSVSSAPLLDGPRIHSLKVPVMIGLYLTKANKGFFKMNVKGGVVGTYILDVDDNNLPQFAKSNIEDYSYGLNAGLGLEFGFITLDFSHEWGMSPLFKQNNIKNNVLRATLGFKL